MKEFTIPAHIPEDYDLSFIEGESRDKYIHLYQSGIEGVNLDGDDLIELVRRGNYLLEPLRDAYMAECTTDIDRANTMLQERYDATDIEELKTYLKNNIDRNSITVKKAKAAFYTPQHELFAALAKSIPAALTLLFTREDTQTDEQLLAAFIALEQPMDMTFFQKQLANFKSFGTGAGCTGNRMHMYATEIKEPTALDLSLKHQGVKNISETKALTPEQIRERNAADSQCGPDGH